MSDLTSHLTPGMLVQNPTHPEWGTGQVQSNINGRITANFPEKGKVVIDGKKIELVPVFEKK